MLQKNVNIDFNSYDKESSFLFSALKRDNAFGWELICRVENEVHFGAVNLNFSN